MKKKLLISASIALILCLSLFISYKNITKNNSNNNSNVNDEVSNSSATNLNNTYNSNKNIIMYFPNWGVYSESHNNLTVGDIPWDKVTVINHAFFTVSKDFKLESTDKDADFEKSFPNSEGWDQGQLRGHIGEYKYYKSKYPNVKVLISVGGWTRGENFHDMAKTKENRKIFIDSIIDFLKKYPFIDGIDIDWEYPGENREKDPNDEYDKGCPGGPEDKENFTLLLKEIRQAYDDNNLPDKMLTIANTGNYEKLQLQEPDKYIEYLDFINVMTYDFHGAFETQTNHHAPIYYNENDPTRYNKYTFCAEDAMKMYVKEYNIPTEKLNVGSPFYSRGWSEVDDSTGKNGLFSTATKAYKGSWDSATSPGGQIPWFQIKEMENKDGWKKYWDDKAKVPYLYNKDLKSMITYEDEKSLKERCNFIIKNNYGGIIVWEITGDDKSKNFPLTTLLWESLGKTTETSTENNSSIKDNEENINEEVMNNNLDGFNINFEVTSDWTSGANWSMTIENNSGKDISSWKVSFDFDKKISQCWEGVLSSSGNTYTISNPSWGGSIKDGSFITVNGACEGNSKDLKIKNIKIEVN
ncbi:glycosyl hydrolase family 18 protein [Clostridium paraputrificum]|uniref:glycosyl hydrolase family 18 protein n=1 Tax=Clostridium paraputrificum TaxID=29363 RepID=UPI00189D5B5F|nr:glycosyl hydrolase family 18 protein [Clostridium paraputrificum]